MIRLKEIALECGVNISTVSRALKNDGRVKESTRHLIRSSAKKLGYTPKLAAQSLVGARTNTV